MTDYVIKSREGKEVTLSIGSSESSIVRILNSMDKLFGIPPEVTLSKCLSHFSHCTLMWDTDPDDIYRMLLAFWSGYLSCEESYNTPPKEAQH